MVIKVKGEYGNNKCDDLYISKETAILPFFNILTLISSSLIVDSSQLKKKSLVSLSFGGIITERARKMERRTRRVKFTEHCTVKPVAAKPSNGSPRVVRIAYTDPFATDSSSDDENDNNNLTVASPTPRVKRYVEEIRFGETKPKAARKTRCKAEKGGRVERKADVSTNPVKYRGVRQRRWGSFAAEIRDSSTRTRIWLGTFATAEEAAVAYDRAAIRLKGHNALTNFLTPPPPPSPEETPPVIDLKTVSRCDSVKQQSLCSPTSVLRFNVKEETEYRTELERKPIDLAAEVKPTAVESLFPDPYSLPELSLAGEYFWDSEFPPEPLFLDEIEITEPVANRKEDNEPEDFSFYLCGDFDASPWDVDDFFEPD